MRSVAHVQVAYDADGLPTDDPARALKGALRTFDRGYKSSNLALMVELLAGPLVGAAHMNKLTAKNWGNLVVASASLRAPVP